MTQLNNSVLWSETLLVNLITNFWWSTSCIVFTLVFHCCLCHVGPQLKKHSAPVLAGFAIPNPAKTGPSRIWKNLIRCNPNIWWHATFFGWIQNRTVKTAGYPANRNRNLVINWATFRYCRSWCTIRAAADELPESTEHRVVAVFVVR